MKLYLQVLTGKQPWYFESMAALKELNKNNTSRYIKMKGEISLESVALGKDFRQQGYWELKSSYQPTSITKNNNNNDN